MRCTFCLDAGFVRRDVPVGHPDFGRQIACPRCDGPGIRNRHDLRAVTLAVGERGR